MLTTKSAIFAFFATFLCAGPAVEARLSGYDIAKNHDDKNPEPRELTMLDAETGGDWEDLMVDEVAKNEESEVTVFGQGHRGLATDTVRVGYYNDGWGYEVNRVEITVFRHGGSSSLADCTVSRTITNDRHYNIASCELDISNEKDAYDIKVKIIVNRNVLSNLSYSRTFENIKKGFFDTSDSTNGDYYLCVKSQGALVAGAAVSIHSSLRIHKPGTYYTTEMNHNNVGEDYYCPTSTEYDIANV